MVIRTTLNISLPLQLGQFIEQRVASGRCEGYRVPPAVARRHNGAKPNRSARRT
jgi:hypothetical protein